MRLAALLLLACSCGPGAWSVHGCPPEWDAARVVRAAEQVTGDRDDYLSRGGSITCHHDMETMDAGCAVPPPKHAAGCSAPGVVWVLIGGPFGTSGSVFGPGEQTTALAHELCHLGIGDRSTEADANACAATVNGLVAP